MRDNRITAEEMSYFVRGPAKLPDDANPTQIDTETYFTLVALETVHANFSGMKESLVDAGM